MTDPRDIMPAIDLLMRAKKNNPLPKWFVVLDYALAGLYLAAFVSGLVFISYKLLSWV